MKGTKIYHNPKCGTSRKTLELLREKGIEPEVIEYLKSPPTAAELKAVVKLLGISPRDLMRKKEKEYLTLNLDDPGKSDSELIAAMVAHPILIERPVVVREGRAVIARPMDRVLEILS